MNKVRTLAQAVGLIAALAFAVTTLPAVSDAAGSATSSWCEENHPGNPQCIEDAYRDASSELGCFNLGCPSWETICCIPVE